MLTLSSDKLEKERGFKSSQKTTALHYLLRRGMECWNMLRWILLLFHIFFFSLVVHLLTVFFLCTSPRFQSFYATHQPPKACIHPHLPFLDVSHVPKRLHLPSLFLIVKFLVSLVYHSWTLGEQSDSMKSI